MARKRLPGMIFDYMDGGAEDEVSLRTNSQDFSRFTLLPKTLVDVSRIDMTTTVMDTPIDFPVILAPTGSSRLFHHKGELAAASSAARAGTVYTVSSMSNYSIEEISSAAPGPKWFQIYVWKDRSVVKEFIQRCKENGYRGLCLTVDLPTVGQRERDLKNGFTVPPSFTLSSLADTALHPHWWWHVLTGPPITIANVRHRAGISLDSATALARYATDQLDPSVTWDDMAWMMEQWNGPFAVKGILSPEDARKAVELGARAIIVSNHGGRQLDQAVSPMVMLPEIVAAAGGRAEVILDGGIRRGTDVIKALALGARACMVGRGYLYGLGAGGEAGVDRALELLRAEIERGLMLLGCPDVKTLDDSYIRFFPSDA